MDLNPQVFFSKITDSLENEFNGHSESLKLLDSFNRSLIEEQIDPELLDLYFPHFYYTSDSLLKFVDEASKKKNFHKPCIKAIEILYTVLNNFYHRLSEQDIISLYTLACRIVKSTADSDIRVKFMDLVMRSLEKNNGCIENGALEVYKNLLKSLIFAMQQKNSDTVKCREMEVSGYLAKKFSFIIDDPERLRSLFLYSFSMYCSVLQRKNPQRAICGFYTGFGNFLESFPPDLKITDQVKNLEKIYSNIKFLAVLNPSDRIKLGNRAALTFFASYNSLFENNVKKGYKYWHEKLLIWLTCGDAERKVGAATLRSIYQTLGRLLCEDFSAESKEIVQYFVKYCKGVLHMKECSNYEKHLAIFCLGEFSLAANKHLDGKEFTDTFLIIMKIFDSTFIQNGNPQDEEWEYLPDYIQTVASFLKINKHTQSHFFCLQKGVIDMIKSFHQLQYLHHQVVVNSFLLTLFYLKNTIYFETFLENVIYQGVVWSCSHQNLAIDAFSEDSTQKIVTVKNYFNLWRGILKLKEYQHFDKSNFNLEIRKSVLEGVVNELVKTLMILINKLKVSVSLKDDCAYTDLEKAYKVDKISDYAIFLNVVDFYKDVFDHIEPKMFRKCLAKMIDHLISKCLKYPLISGFYKLLSYCLKISRNLSLFKDENHRQDVKNTQETLTDFLSILLKKMEDFKDDLLISCLQVLLETPVEVIEPMLLSCATVFSSALTNIFEVGRSYLPLADTGIDTLEYWQANLDPESLVPILAKVLPGLDSFLRSRSSKGYSIQPVEKKRKTLQALKRRKVQEEIEPELMKLQRKILCFIGRQSLKNCQNFIFSDNFTAQSFIGSQSSHLKLSLPYNDLHLDIYLDTFLQRIIELALYSSDRKTRILSCELLQACVMVFLGRAKQMSTAGLEDSSIMLKTIVVPLLHLSCDIDQVVRQLFEPLFFQLVHWYTSPTQASTPHSSIIIEALMEGITHPTNPNLKDFCGKCIKEFVKWSLKHQNLNPEDNIKVLIRNMRYFSTHPDPSKKLGAALIFNSIYSDLREEDKFVSKFWMEILHIFILSLDSIPYLEETTTVLQIKNSLKHLQRVFEEKSAIFYISDDKRRVPHGFNNDRLSGLAIWLINQTKSNSKHCRDACYQLFHKIAPITDSYGEVSNFIRSTTIYSTKLVHFEILSKQPHRDVTSLLNYLNNLTCCLEGYNFLIKNDVVLNLTDEVFKETQFFMKKLLLLDFIACLNSIETKTWTHTTIDKENFVCLKSACIFSIINLFNNTPIKSRRAILTEEFYTLVVKAVLFPQDLGIKTVSDDNKKILAGLLNEASNSSALSEALRDVQPAEIDLEKNVSLRKRDFLNGIIFLSSTMTNFTAKSGFCLDVLVNETLSKLKNDLEQKANGDLIFVSQVQDTAFSYLSPLLKIAFNKDVVKSTKNLLFSNYFVQTIDMSQRQHLGLFIASTFSDSVIPEIVSDKNLANFLKTVHDRDTKTAADLIIFIMNYIIKEKYKICYNNVIENVSMLWNIIGKYSRTDNTKTDLAIEFSRLYLQISDVVPTGVFDFLLDCLKSGSRNDHLEIFGILASITIDKSDSDKLGATVCVLNQKINSETSNQEVINNNFNKLLTFLPAVKSLPIFEYLISDYIIRTPTVDIQNLLNKFISQLDPKVQNDFLQKSYEMCTITTANNILQPLFQNCNITCFNEFFITNIKDMLSILENEELEKSIKIFVLVEILFLRIPLGTEEGKNCEIIEKTNLKKLVQTLLKFALGAFQTNKTQDDLVRKYKCYAYNALASIICNRKEKNFYIKLFIRENKNGEDLLWHRIVNTDINYDFPKEFDSLPTKRKVLVNIRNELRRTRSSTSESSGGSLRYIESQRLFNSSLSEDVTKFDFTNSALRTEHEAMRKMYENLQTKSEVYLDTTEINEHECMGTICSVIQHIFDSGVYVLPAEGEEVVKLPDFLNGIKNLLLKASTHKNVKIFLVKVIDNMIHIFSRYAKYFLEPLIQFIVDRIAGETINYFVTDVLVILSKWSSEIPNLSETESSLASKLIEHFVKNIKKDRQDVFKFNIELLKLLVESWKNYITPPIDTIFELLSTKGTAETGIYVSSVFLVNKLVIWQQGKDEEFLNVMTEQINLQNPRATYRACAETVGSLLCMLRKQDFDVTSLFTSVKDVEEIYVVCLEGIAIKFPQAIGAYDVARLISTFHHMQTPAKITHLKLILKRLELSLDVLEKISEFSIVAWGDLIEDSNLEIQILSLEIVKKCITVFCTYEVFPDILNALSRNIYHPNAVFRACLFDTAIAIYDLHKDQNDICKNILIYGLVDPDLENQKKVTDFWSQSPDLPRSLIERFSYLLSEIYRTKIEDKLLGLSTYFLLGLLKDTEKYESEIFEHPLEDCDFEEYKLHTSWKLQHPSVVPMFAETFDITSMEGSSSEVERDVFLLKRTQATLGFAPTQSYQEQELSKYTSLESTVGIDMDSVFKNPNNVGLSQTYKLKKGRFLKDKSKISRSFAHYEIQKKIKKVQERADSATERERKVTLYRKYRKGDFPDIQISLSAILDPLQILALHDSEVSKILFLELFKGVASKTENNTNFLTRISGGIKNVFETSLQFNSYLFSALFDILLKHKEKISYDADLITRVARDTGLASIGALLIEEYIITGVVDDGPSTSKRTTTTTSKETEFWLKLAELYKDLQEWDTVRAIFLEKVDCDYSLQEAITYESKSMYRDAQYSYKTLVSSDCSDMIKDFYYESYFKCFADLGEWERVPKAVETVMTYKDVWKGLWEDDWYKQKLLPWYITSSVKTQLHTEIVNEEFLKNLNETLKHPTNSEYLTSNFPEELCILWLSQNDIVTANQYLKTIIKNFLEDWHTINPMFQSQRFQKLLNLQNVIEIADFIKIFDRLTDDIDGSLETLTDRWRGGFKDEMPSILFAETKLLYRRQFINIVTDKLSKMEGLNLRAQIKEMKVAKVRMDVDLINTAAETGYFYITRKYLRPYFNKDNEKLRIAKGTYFVLKSGISEGITNKIDMLIEAVNTLKGKYSDEAIELQSAQKQFDTLLKISELLAGSEPVFEEYKDQLCQLTDEKINSASDLSIYAMKYLKNTLENSSVEEMDTDSSDNNSESTQKFRNISSAYTKLAYFIKESQEDNLQGDFISCVLRAMRLNSSEARQLFPCILMIENLGTEHKNSFVNEVDRIPTWMFLAWIPQLLANVDSPKIFAISKILLRIAETYPEAIKYPYRLSKENYNFANDDSLQAALELIDRLDELLLQDERINEFLKALSFVSIPVVILRYYIGKIVKSHNMETVKKYVASVHAEVFNFEIADGDNLQGNMFKTISKFKKHFNSFTATGMTIPKVKELGTRLNAELGTLLKWDKKVKKSLPSYLLKDYSPFLANFSANKLNLELEIPGQYDGKKLPLPQHHVKISGFHHQISIMSSLRRPIKITILGMDTKEYPFLIKFGEDIRQDQRIEQLFGLVNDFLRNDKACSNSGFNILTYQVIPLSTNLGMIQWVNNTQPLKEFIKKSLKNAREIKEFEEDVLVEYVRNLKGGTKNEFHAYGSAAVRITKDRIVANYQTLVRKVPWDILRKSFWSLSINTENYIALRNNFIKSYSIICAVHWILGIGDRHLGNSLISLNTGKVLGIDFGHAFGTATQILPVPELVPFRLTPHLVNLMEPLREKGPFREYMIHCIRCLRANNPSLLATMKVFIQEPSLDWLEHAGDTCDSQSEVWYPAVKIEQAKRKLEGESSRTITIEELNDGCRDESYTNAYITHVQGDQNSSENKNLSVEDQVDCLLNHATDENLLGRMWQGWNPWV